MRFRSVLQPKAMEINAVKSCRALNSPKMYVLVSLLALITVTPLCGQTQDQTSELTPQERTSIRAPLPRLYWHFLMYQRFLDSKADEIEKKGKVGTGLRENLQRRLGFDSYKMELIRQTALKLESDLKKKDQQARAIVDEFHAKYPPDKPLSGPIPPPPAELFQLQRERENLIEKHAADLKAQLGPEASAKLDSFLMKVIAPNVETQDAKSTPALPSAANAGQGSKAVQP